MSELAITRAAFESIYTACDSLIVDASLKRLVGGLVPASISVFLLHGNGVVSLPDEKISGKTRTVSFIGLPGGVLGVVARRANRSLVDAFQQHAARHNPHTLPRSLIVSGFSRKQTVLRFLNDLLGQRVGRDRQSLSRMQKQLSALRTGFQKLSLALDKSERMMRNTGLDTQMVVFDLPPGTASVGPGDADGGSGYCQSLPVDIAGVVALELHVASVTAGAGNLVVAIRGVINKKVVASFTVAFEDFVEGWHHFSLQEPVSQISGGAELCVLWQPVDSSLGAGPQFSRADEIADRFGDEKSQSLAMRIETGYRTPELTPTADDVTVDILAHTPIMASDLFGKGGFLGGHALEIEGNNKRGWPVLKVDTQEGWLQTHPLADDVAAFHAARCVAPFAREVEAFVGLEHEKAAPCIAVLAAFDPGIVGEADVHKLIARIGKSNSPSMAGSQDGISWCAAPLVAMVSTRLRLNFNAPLTNMHDIVLAAVPLFEDDQSFGWCRWRELRFGYQLPEEKTTSMSLTPTKPHTSRAVRVHSFTDIAERIVFYRGRYAHDQLRANLGFLPIQMLDDVGAMQTNPLEETVCAAILDGGLPEYSRRLACEVGTAHANAQRFSYIIGLVSKDAASPQELIEDVGRQVQDQQYVGQTDAVAWSSVTVSAMKKRRIALDLPAWSKQGDLPFFLAVPADGSRQFGWCRWYSLAIETARLSDGTKSRSENTGADGEEAARKLA